MISNIKTSVESYFNKYAETMSDFGGHLSIDYDHGWIQKTNELSEDDDLVYVSRFNKIVEYDGSAYVFKIRAVTEDESYMVAFDIFSMIADTDDEGEVQTYASEIIRDEEEFKEKKNLESWINEYIEKYDEEQLIKRLNEEDDDGRLE